MDLELILFKACPFAQRVTITLLHTGLPYQQTLINPADRPDWLRTISPLGQVPLLRVNGDTVLFDSSVINEFINDSAGAGLLPADALDRARCRATIEFGGNCMSDFSAMITAPDEAAFGAAREKLMKKLHWLEAEWSGDDRFFTGGRFSLVDASYGPLFMRMNALEAIVPFQEPEVLPRVSRWGTSLLAMDAVKNSIGRFDVLFKKVVQSRGKGGFVDSRLG